MYYKIPSTGNPMATTRSVRLDAAAERALAEIRKQSGQSISSVIKDSLIAFHQATAAPERAKPSEFFEQYDLGPGGYAIGPARESKRLLKEKLARRHLRR
jgi:hypothetical protein